MLDRTANRHFIGSRPANNMRSVIRRTIVYYQQLAIQARWNLNLGDGIKRRLEMLGPVPRADNNGDESALVAHAISESGQAADRIQLRFPKCPASLNSSLASAS